MSEYFINKRTLCITQKKANPPFSGPWEVARLGPSVVIASKQHARGILQVPWSHLSFVSYSSSAGKTHYCKAVYPLFVGFVYVSPTAHHSAYLLLFFLNYICLQWLRPFSHPVPIALPIVLYLLLFLLQN